MADPINHRGRAAKGDGDPPRKPNQLLPWRKLGRVEQADDRIRKARELVKRCNDEAGQKQGQPRRALLARRIETRYSAR